MSDGRHMMTSWVTRNTRERFAALAHNQDVIESPPRCIYRHTGTSADSVDSGRRPLGPSGRGDGSIDGTASFGETYVGDAEVFGQNRTSTSTRRARRGSDGSE